MEFTYPEFARMPGEVYSGGVYVPCIYSHAKCDLYWWSLCTLNLLACQVRYIPLVEFMYPEFTRMPGEIYLWWSLYTPYLLACQVRFTSGGVYVP